jgi:hypothetical protein
MNQINTQAMIAKLMSNAAGLRYGSVSVTAKVHDGRIVQVSYSTQEHTRDTEFSKEKTE